LAQLLLVAVTTETEDGVAIPWTGGEVVPPPLPVGLPPAVLTDELPPQPASNPNTAATHALPKTFLHIIAPSLTQADDDKGRSVICMRQVLKSGGSRTGVSATAHCLKT
jgi:hypothetical protein